MCVCVCVFVQLVYNVKTLFLYPEQNEIFSPAAGYGRGHTFARENNIYQNWSCLRASYLRDFDNINLNLEQTLTFLIH